MIACVSCLKRARWDIFALFWLLAILVREGRERSVDPAELVVGDVVRLGAGDQVVVDGAMVGEGAMEVDESLLTGDRT